MRLTIKFAASAAAALVCSSAFAADKSVAAASPPICNALVGIIQADEMDISVVTADEIAEDSAPRAAVDEGEVSADYLQIQSNLMVMTAHHCAPYGHPISASYLANAMVCKTDRMKAIIAGNFSVQQEPDSCDHSKWTRVN